jgi:hypothetical protein
MQIEKLDERSYRSIDRDSYSSIKDFLDDRIYYYRKYIIGENIKIKETKAMVFGNLVDCLLLEPHKFDEKFHIATSQRPSPQMLQLAEALFERTKQDCDEEGIIQSSFDNLFHLAFKDVKYDRDGNDVAFRRKGQTVHTVQKDFISGPAFEWYKQLRISYGRTLVEAREISNAEKVVNELKTNGVTSGIVNLTESKRYGVYNQEKILFSYSGQDLKCMADKIIIDHQERKVFVYDLKTTWDVEDNFMKNFFNRRYYIQAAVYDIAVKNWIQDMGLSYQVVPMKFIVTDSTNYQAPLIYECTQEVLEKSLEGFEYLGKEYIGLNQALEEIKWHKESGQWTSSATNQQNKGRVKIKF